VSGDREPSRAWDGVWAGKNATASKMFSIFPPDVKLGAVFFGESNRIR
jgi:hypothetical protein